MGYLRTTDLSSTASSHAQPVSAAAAAIWQRRRVEILKYFLNSVALLARLALDASSDACLIACAFHISRTMPRTHTPHATHDTRRYAPEREEKQIGLWTPLSLGSGRFLSPMFLSLSLSLYLLAAAPGPAFFIPQFPF